MTVSMYSTLSSFIVQFSMDGILKDWYIQIYHLSWLWMHHLWGLWNLPKKIIIYLECSCYTLLCPTSAFLQKNILVQLGYLFDIYYLLGLNFWSAMPLILSFPSRHNFWDNVSIQPKTSVYCSMESLVR